MHYVDLSYLREIAGDDEQFVTESIHSFIHSTPVYLEEVRHRAQAKDSRELQAAAHRLKSAAQYLGAAELVHMIGEIEEEAAGEADWEALQPLVAKMNVVWEALLVELKRELQKLEAAPT